MAADDLEPSEHDLTAAGAGLEGACKINTKAGFNAAKVRAELAHRGISCGSGAGADELRDLLQRHCSLSGLGFPDLFKWTMRKSLQGVHDDIYGLRALNKPELQQRAGELDLDTGGILRELRGRIEEEMLQSLTG